MRAFTNLTGVLSEHKKQYHAWAVLHPLVFHWLWFAESFRVLNVFSFVFDSNNSVVDIVADEINHISTKRDDSGSVGPFSPLVSVCLTHPERNAK